MSWTRALQAERSCGYFVHIYLNLFIYLYIFILLLWRRRNCDVELAGEGSCAEAGVAPRALQQRSNDVDVGDVTTKLNDVTTPSSDITNNDHDEVDTK